jgi:endonuclease III
MTPKEQSFFTCLRALSRIVQHQWYSDKRGQLKTPQGIWEWFVTCLLDQSVTREQHFRTMSKLKTNGWLDYHRLQQLMINDESKLEQDLRGVLSSYRFPNKATKAILTNLKKIDHDYDGSLHNLYFLSQKDTAEVWKRLNDLYWFGTKKACVFIREMITQGLWELDLGTLPIPPDSRVRRVLFQLGLIKDRNDLKEVEQVSKTLAKKALLTSLDLDYVLWTVGDPKICGERKAECRRCPLEEYCPKVTTKD